MKLSLMMLGLPAVLLIIFIAAVAETNSFDNILEDVSSCEQICLENYPLHTYPEPDDLLACNRGCRLYTIVEFASEDNSTATANACFDACFEAYGEDNVIEQDTDEYFDSYDGRDGTTLSACQLGCSRQQPYAQRPCPMDDLMDFEHKHYVMTSDDMDREIFRMWNQLNGIVEMFNGFFGAGDVMVAIEMPMFDIDDVEMDAFIIIESSDSEYYYGSSDFGKHISATDKPKNSLTTNRLDLEPVVMRPGEIQWEKRDRDISLKQHHPDQFNYSSWLDCITKKSGIPKWLLCSSVILAVMALLWLVCGTHSNNNASEIHTQRLSIYGDVDYLKDVKYKVMYYHPTTLNDADPLPLKVALKKECSDI